MILKNLFDPLALLVQLLVTVSLYRDGLDRLDLDSIFKPQGYSTATYVFKISADKMSLPLAQAWCSDNKMDLFTPTKDMNLTHFFATLETTSVWTQVFESKITKSWVNLDQFSPIKATNDTVIQVPTLVASELNGISLDLSTDKVFAYTSSVKTSAKTVVCMEEISFPNRLEDRQKLAVIQKSLIQKIGLTENTILEFEESVKRRILALPKILNPVETSWYTDIIDVDLNATVSQMILSNLSLLVEPMVNKFKTITVHEDIDVLLLADTEFHSLIQIILSKISDPLNNPFKNIPWSLQERIEKGLNVNTDPELATSNILGKNYLFTKFAELGKNEQMISRNFSSLKFFNTEFEGFFSITMADLVLSVFAILEGLALLVPCLAKCCSEIMYRRRMNRLGKENLQQSLYRVRKIQLPASRDAEKTKARSRSNSIQFELTQRKCRAPSPPHSKIRTQKRNKKSNNDPYYVKVLNDNLPMHEGNSMLGD